MPNPIFYTGSGLDRSDELRDDADWVAAQRADARSRIFPIWRDRVLVHANATPVPHALIGKAARAAFDAATEVVFLGRIDGVAQFAADVSALDEAAAASLANGAEFVELRQTAPVMAVGDGSLLAYARGMLYWHRRHRFCGTCGSPTVATPAGHVRNCTNPACVQPHFPRTDPAVIMLVVRPGPNGGSALLGHKATFLPGMYSTLAGYVEPGESLEEAVAREVMEETGVAVTDVRYRASQPWPFPASLMLGFRARATSDAIRLNTHELDDAAWFTRDDVARMGETGKRLPRGDSIALWLIDEWLNEDGDMP